MWILKFEYVDFSKLLPQDKIVQQEDQRFTFINKGGILYLVPAGDSKDGAIQNYAMWDQAFRVFSEIVSTKYPAKSTELIQYSHIIHTAAQTYLWENVYSYDKDFRIHISKNPTRTWSVILQQAWSMHLKERLKDFGSVSAKSGGSTPGNRSREYCRRFQKGKCNDRIHCKYDHHCAICNKFGHGAHICRRRGQSNAGQNDYDDRYDRYHYQHDWSPRRSGGKHHHNRDSGKSSDHKKINN